MEHVMEVVECSSRLTTHVTVSVSACKGGVVECMLGRLACMGLRVEVGAARKQPRHHVRPVVLGGTVQRRLA